MLDLFTFENLGNLLILLFLQAVLGFDNLLYISIESKRAPAEHQAYVRRLGIGLALALRLVLLVVIVLLLDVFKEPLFAVHLEGVLEGSFTLGAAIFLFGGAFIMYTAMKEISHMLAIQHMDADVEKRGAKSVGQVVFWIVLMNVIFSFDSILSAIAITDFLPVLALAIIGSAAVMLLLADRVAEFLERNRMYEVLGLFILLLVGVLLMSEGGHESHLTLLGYPVEKLSKTTFYFSVGVMVLLDIVQSRYQKKLLAAKRAEITRKA